MYRPGQDPVCRQCHMPPALYDWLYLGFVTITTLQVEAGEVALITELHSQAHWVAIDYTAKCRQFTRPVLALHCSALLEVAVAALATLLLSPPVGSLHLTSCGVVRQLALTSRARGYSIKTFKDIEWNIVALHVTGSHQACGLVHPPVQPSP